MIEIVPFFATDTRITQCLAGTVSRLPKVTIGIGFRGYFIEFLFKFFFQLFRS